MNETTQSVHAALLPFLGVLRIGGDDAVRFLQGQLTNDVQLLADGRTQLAAYNTPQGRVIALLRLHQSDDAIYALLPTELLERVSALLRRFVLRSKVDLQIATDLQVGWIGTAALSPSMDAAAYDATRTVSALPSTMATHMVSFDYAPGRQVIAVPPDAWRSITGLSPTRAYPRILDEWLAADIREGWPQVFAATSEAFVPQMLNLDLLDAISFKKGCYTGQEIVARTQNLGRIKRRMFRFLVTGGPAPAVGDKLVEGAAHAGDVVSSASVGSGAEFLAVVNLDQAHRSLRLAAAPEFPLSLLPLPYPVESPPGSQP
jgi:hypothetical protein